MRVLRSRLWRTERLLLDWVIGHDMAWHGVEFSELGPLEGLEYMIPPVSFCSTQPRWTAGILLGNV